MLKPLGEVSTMSDSLNIQYYNPTFIFRSYVEESIDEHTPPFYTSLNIHNAILHNSMHDSGSSHNLMPKVIMEELGLEVTMPYKYLFYFYSIKFRCLGLIKYLVVSLAQVPTENLVMDVVVDDIPPKFGMLLSISWASKIKGSI